MLKNSITTNSGRGLARRKELQQVFQQVSDRSKTKIDRDTRCLIKNSTGDDLPVFSVLHVVGILREPESAKDIDLAFGYALDGNSVTEDDATKISITQAPINSNAIGHAVYSGVTPVRITGEAGKQFATTKSGETALKSADSGPFEILYDESDADSGYAPGERYALVSFSAQGSADGSSGGGSIVTRDQCCDEPIPFGLVGRFGLMWATNYQIAGSEPLSDDITNQGDESGDEVWESDTINKNCNEGTDEYIIKMLVSGTDPGQIIVRYYMENGGGYDGESACCHEETGIVLEYTNLHKILDPLAGFKLYRDQSQMQGLFCEVGPCVICVIPRPSENSCADCSIPSVMKVPIKATGKFSGIDNDFYTYNRNALDGFHTGYAVGAGCSWGINLDRWLAGVYDNTRYIWDLPSPVTSGVNTVDRMGLSVLAVNGFGTQVVFHIQITLFDENGPTAAVYRYVSDPVECSVLDDLEGHEITLNLNEAGSTAIDHPKWPASEWPDSIVVTPVDIVA